VLCNVSFRSTKSIDKGQGAPLSQCPAFKPKDLSSLPEEKGRIKK